MCGCRAILSAQLPSDYVRISEMVILDAKAERRSKVLTAVLTGQLTAVEAAALLGLTDRHVRRLAARLEAEGPAALVHGNRGRVPANLTPEALKDEILELAATEYPGFNDVHLMEALSRDHGIRIGRETLRGWLREAGRPPKRKRRSPAHRSRRQRRPQRGMMVQWDGSHEHWFGPEHPKLVLMAAVDDADGKLVGTRFMPSDSGAAYLLTLDEILKREGIPASLYQDRHGALHRNDGHWSLQEELAGVQAPTQIGAVLEDLGIEPIFARSAQGKGRIERYFGVAQDRLIAELAYAGITTIEEGNQFLDEYWYDAFNERFAKEPAQAETQYCPIDEQQRRQVVSFRYHRKVANDNTVRLGDVTIQIPPGPRGRSYAKARVEARQHVDGTWSVLYQGRQIAMHSATPLQMPSKVHLRRSGRRRVRGVMETLQVYFEPRELPEEAARFS